MSLKLQKFAKQDQHRVERTLQNWSGRSRPFCLPPSFAIFWKLKINFVERSLQMLERPLQTTLPKPRFLSLLLEFVEWPLQIWRGRSRPLCPFCFNLWSDLSKFGEASLTHETLQTFPWAPNSEWFGSSSQSFILPSKHQQTKTLQG